MKPIACKYSSSRSNGKKPIQVQLGFCLKNDTLQLHVNSKVNKENFTISSTNIKKIHDKFKKKGKATIEFKNPDHMIMISDVSIFYLVRR